MKETVRQYKETWNHYDKVRYIALEEAHDELRSVLVTKNKAVLKSEITLAGLDQVTFRKLVSWHYYGERLAKWDWQAVEKHIEHTLNDSSLLFGIANTFLPEQVLEDQLGMEKSFGWILSKQIQQVLQFQVLLQRLF